MRLNSNQIKVIHEAVSGLAGKDAVVSLFGSRIDDQQRGGDIDLLVDVPGPVDEPGWLSSRISARISLKLGGRKIDVIISAPNLKQYPIHDTAKKEGIVL